MYDDWCTGCRGSILVTSTYFDKLYDKHIKTKPQQLLFPNMWYGRHFDKTLFIHVHVGSVEVTPNSTMIKTEFSTFDMYFIVTLVPKTCRVVFL